jgi:hypothetical protein
MVQTSIGIREEEFVQANGEQRRWDVGQRRYSGISSASS